MCKIATLYSDMSLDWQFRVTVLIARIRHWGGYTHFRISTCSVSWYVMQLLCTACDILYSNNFSLEQSLIGIIFNIRDCQPQDMQFPHILHEHIFLYIDSNTLSAKEKVLSSPSSADIASILRYSGIFIKNQELIQKSQNEQAKMLI